MQSVYLQRIMKKNATKGYEKQSQNNPNLRKAKMNLKSLAKKIRPHPALDIFESILDAS